MNTIEEFAFETKEKFINYFYYLKANRTLEFNKQKKIESESNLWLYQYTNINYRR